MAVEFDNPLAPYVAKLRPDLAQHYNMDMLFAREMGHVRPDATPEQLKVYAEELIEILDERIDELCENYYQCPECENEWTDIWDGDPSMDCPECGAEDVSAYKSVTLHKGTVGGEA